MTQKMLMSSSLKAKVIQLAETDAQCRADSGDLMERLGGDEMRKVYNDAYLAALVKEKGEI